MAEIIDNRYQLLEKIGEGGMGAVYKAWDLRLERHVAVKRLHLMGRSEDVEEFLIRFEREAKAMARLQHPNIVGVHDYGKDAEGVYLVMDFMPYGTLKDQMTQAMRPQMAAALLIPIAEALHYIHDRGLIHRDVKPANILIDDRGQPRLSDFGVIKMVSGDVTDLTQSGYAIGTPAYMAPEMVEGEVLPQSDQYALGVIFYELVTGKKPYEGKTPMETMLLHKTQPFPNPRLYVNDLGQDVITVLRRTLAKKPEERFTTMHDFSRALKNIQPAAATPAKARPIPQQVSPRVQPVQQPADPRSAPAQKKKMPPSQSGKKNNWLPFLIVGVGAALFIGLVGAIIWTVLSDSIRPTETSALTVNLTETSLAVVTETVEIVATTTAAPTEPEPTVEAPIVEPSMTPGPEATPVPATEVVPTIENTEVPTEAPIEAGSVVIREADGMPMVYVPAGPFQMGSTDEQLAWNLEQEWCDETCAVENWSAEQPAHKVVLDAFWMDQYEVSNAQYLVCETAGACQPPSQERSFTRDTYYRDNAYGDYPVIYVGWQDASDYCAFVGGRLPTEAEWEKAARGEESFIYPWGDVSPDESRANYEKYNPDTTRVGQYPTGLSSYGVFDMAGNVWEWVADYWGETYYQTSETENPTGPESGESRIIRGGAFHNAAGDIRSALRLEYPADQERYFVGFRCVVPAP